MSIGRLKETRRSLPPSAPRRRPRVSWLRQGEVQSLVVDRPVVAGAAPSADLVVDDPMVSRVHLELEPRPDGLWARDLGSTNGTWIEGVRVNHGRVPDGGTLRIGDTELRVEHHASMTNDLWPEDRFGPLVGQSPKMRELFAAIAQVAPSDASVLVHGETGTGKEVVARAIHDASPRSTKPFVIVDCGALAESLLDAELFGHTKGAFTGAHAARAGAIEEADGGTLFLDEIGELPVALQPKLLRVLESKTIRRVGEVSYRRVDVRFVAATHRGLLDMVAAGEFREDLYFRLAVLPLFVPPLRERREDIELLMSHFLGSAFDKVPDTLLSAMRRRMWRGNVRELRNFAERVQTLGAGVAMAMMEPAPDPAPEQPVVIASPANEEAEPPQPSFVPKTPPASPVPLEQPFKPFREAWIEHGERMYIEALLGRVPRLAAAVKEAAVDRTHLYRLIRKYTR